MKAKKWDWRNFRRRRLPHLIGDFFEELAKHVVFAHRPENGDGFDLVTECFRVGIEVKSSDTGHQFRLPDDQFERHGGLTTGFPYEHGLYMFISYYQRRVGSVASERWSSLVYARDEHTVAMRLSGRTKCVHIAHFDLVSAIKRQNGVKNGCLPPDPHCDCVVVTHAMLRKLSSEKSAVALASLGLIPQEWTINRSVVSPEIELGLLTEKLRDLPVTTILPLGFPLKHEELIRV